MAKRKPEPFWELLDAAGQDSLTTAWERAFLTSIRGQVEKRGQPWLSDEQSRVLARIALKIGVELPPAVRDLVDEQPHREVMAVALDARGDPRLTAWEEGFLVSVVEAARICRPLSEKQLAVLDKIAAKVAEPVPTEDLSEILPEDADEGVPALGLPT